MSTCVRSSAIMSASNTAGFMRASATGWPGLPGITTVE
jgi:hypothetical protein